VQAINGGAISHFFTKPCDMVALAFTIEQTLHQRTPMQAARRLGQQGQCQATTLEHVERRAPDPYTSRSAPERSSARQKVAPN
jgi:hypothetical protein